MCLLLNPEGDRSEGEDVSVCTYRSGTGIYLYVYTQPCRESARDDLLRKLPYFSDLNAFQDPLLHSRHCSLDLA